LQGFLQKLGLFPVNAGVLKETSGFCGDDASHAPIGSRAASRLSAAHRVSG
jgi:hypothetical protein